MQLLLGVKGRSVCTGYRYLPVVRSVYLLLGVKERSGIGFVRSEGEECVYRVPVPTCC